MYHDVEGVLVERFQAIAGSHQHDEEEEIGCTFKRLQRQSGRRTIIMIVNNKTTTFQQFTLMNGERFHFAGTVDYMRLQDR